MFSALRQGNTLYILEKGEQPVLKIGQIEGVKPSQNSQQVYGIFNPNAKVDITVKFGEDRLELKEVPAHTDVADYGGGIISETPEQMASRVSGMLQQSRQIVESVDYHKNLISAFEDILKRLSPNFAKEKERDEAISSLNIRVDGMQQSLDKIVSILTNKAEK